MNKSVFVHLKNKYPDGRVIASGNSIDVFAADGEHIISIQKDGNGDWHDKSAELGLSQRLCMAPIPKDARVHKLNRDGSIGLDEKAEERKQARSKFQCQKSGKIKSIAEIDAEGSKSAGSAL